jgi:MYXO-CTERM domain-containing protein
VIGAPPPASVPGPLPLLGAGAAFGWARRLRKRTQLP